MSITNLTRVNYNINNIHVKFIYYMRMDKNESRMNKSLLVVNLFNIGLLVDALKLSSRLNNLQNFNWNTSVEINEK